MSQALDAFYPKRVLLEESRELKEKAEGKRAQAQFNVDQVLEARKRFEAEERGAKAKAELIYQHYARVEEVLSVMKKAVSKGMEKKEVMYKVKLAEEKGLIPQGMVKSVDPKKKKLILNLKKE